MQKGVITALAILSASMVSAQTLKNYEQGDPNDPNYAYLKDFSPLKNYIDYEKYPNFKLGIGTTVDEYLSNPTVAGFTNDNFTETVAGNAMKMSSCVFNDGNMDFTRVTRYVEAAEMAGINVYGHTLAWHSQQPNGWLRGLIKDKAAVPFENPDTIIRLVIGSKDFRTNQNVGWTSDKNQFGYSLTFSNDNGLNISTSKINNNFWDVQFIAYDNIPVDAGKPYKFTYEIKGSADGKMHSKLGDWNNGDYIEFPFTQEWKEVAVEYTSPVSNPFLLLQCGDFAGDIYIRNIKVTDEVGAMKIDEKRRFLKVAASAKKSDAWDNQFWIVVPSFAAGQSFEFTADVRADKAAVASTQIHHEPGTYVDYRALGNINFTTDWKTVTVSGQFSAGGESIAFNLNELADANNYYFDNISLKIGGAEKIVNGSIDSDDFSSFRMKIDRGAVVAPVSEHTDFTLKIPQSTPLSKDEKREVLANAMEKWIKGMMAACNGKVKAWDVVNEAIGGGGNDGEGNYTLQHSEGFNGDATWDVGGDAFYWQDHMGDLEYVRTAVKFARKYGPDDIKLFINDYNLESDWDGNHKVKSLINWIKKWEADGVTFIDGIGTQMHLSYYENSGTMASKKNAITKMFELMAASGKLVRVSEFDMGYVNASGQTLHTSQLTETQHKNMADYYEWILKEFFRLVPPEQQWGFCFWCPTDSPTNSGWRANEPVGLWTLNTCYRKHAYAGVVRGLGGVDHSNAVEDVFADPESWKNSASGIYDIKGFRYPAGVKYSDLPAGIYVIDGKVIKKK